MFKGIDQSGSDVEGDQVAGDKIVHIYGLKVKKELATASNILLDDGLSLEDFVQINADDENTVLINKLTDGGFNSQARKNAKMQKLRAVSTVINMSKTEYGKEILKNVYMNLMTVINTKYIALMAEGETLRTSLVDILEDFSDLVNKYKEIFVLDEAFLEGLLYIATSSCALKWLMEDDDDYSNDSQ